MRPWQLALLGISALLAVSMLWYLLPLQVWVESFRQWVLTLGAAGVVVFMCVHLLFTLLVAPVSILVLMAGVAYGAWGFPLVVMSGVVSAVIALFAGRYLAHNVVARFLRSNAKLHAVQLAVSQEGWKVACLIRLAPIFPFGVQNYLLSFSTIRVLPYALATLVGILPSSALLVYLGTLGQGSQSNHPLMWVFLLVCLVATIVVFRLIARRAAATLAEWELGDS